MKRNRQYKDHVRDIQVIPANEVIDTILQKGDWDFGAMISFFSFIQGGMDNESKLSFAELMLDYIKSNGKDFDLEIGQIEINY